VIFDGVNEMMSGAKDCYVWDIHLDSNVYVADPSRSCGDDCSFLLAYGCHLWLCPQVRNLQDSQRFDFVPYDHFGVDALSSSFFLLSQLGLALSILVPSALSISPCLSRPV
jgi:hypothetical protein